MKSIPPTSNEGLFLKSLLLNAIPGNLLLLLPNVPTFTIAAVSDHYLAAFGIQRERMVGNEIFEVFFRNRLNEAIAPQLHPSLTQVVATKQIQAMADQPHQWPNAQTGVLEWRTWRPVSEPRGSTS